MSARRRPPWRPRLAFLPFVLLVAAAACSSTTAAARRSADLAACSASSRRSATGARGPRAAAPRGAGAHRLGRPARPGPADQGARPRVVGAVRGRRAFESVLRGPLVGARAGPSATSPYPQAPRARDDADPVLGRRGRGRRRPLDRAQVTLQPRRRSRSAGWCCRGARCTSCRRSRRCATARRRCGTSSWSRRAPRRLRARGRRPGRRRRRAQGLLAGVRRLPRRARRRAAADRAAQADADGGAARAAAGARAARSPARRRGPGRRRGRARHGAGAGAGNRWPRRRCSA